MEDEPWDELSGPPPTTSRSTLVPTYPPQSSDDEIIMGVQRNLAASEVAVTTNRTTATTPSSPPRSFPPPSAFQRSPSTHSQSQSQDPPAPTASMHDNYSEQGDDEYYESGEDADELGGGPSPSIHQQPDAYSIRQEALKMLEVADDHLANSPYSVHRTLSGGFMATHRLLTTPTGTGSGSGYYDASQDADGADDADDDGEYGLVGTRWSGTSGSGSGRRLPSALSGLAYTASRRPYRDDPPYPMEDNASTASYASSTRDRDPYYAASKSTTYNTEDYDNDDAAVDVIAMERRNSTYGRGGAAPSFSTPSPSDNNNNTKPWSSRYSVDRTLLAMSGGSTSASHNKRFLDSMDRAHQRERQAARNLFGSAPEGAKSSGIFGAAGYNFRSKYVFGRQGVTVPSNQNLYEDEERSGAGAASSLPPPTARKSWHEQLLAKRRQRRIVIAVAVALLIFIIAMTSILAKNKNNAPSSMSPDAPTVDLVGDGTDNNSGPPPQEVDQTQHLVSFYATSDVPYTKDDQTRLSTELAKLDPTNSAFLIHLGNIQSATTSSCNPDNYPSVATLLAASPLTTFVIPGQEDWPDCPDQDGSWDLWRASFTFFEERFPRDFAVNHQSTRKENFAFVSSGVFFAGIHVVAGSPYTSNDDPNERAFRNGDNIEWIKQMVSHQARNATAIVIFGNAKPNGVDNQSFFNSLASFLKLYGLPSMYVHASDVAETGDGTQQLYQPFSTASNVVALQVAQGGVNPPARISVAAGPKTFVVS